MRVGILGTGTVGTTLATGFADAGYDVMFGSRDPSQPRLAEWASIDPEHRQIGDYRRTAEFGDLVIAAVPGRALPEMLDRAGRESFSGSILIDVTNPILRNDEGVIVNAFGDEDSGAEFLQRELPRVPVVKAFNEVGAAYMMHPEAFSTHVLRICGDDPDAKRRVSEVVAGFGWQATDLGSLSRARSLEQGVVDRLR